MKKSLYFAVTLLFLASCSRGAKIEEGGDAPEFGPGAKSRYLNVLGSKLHFVEAGHGDPILFVHGNPSSSYLWRNVVPHLAKQGRVIAIDLIGMGKSGKPDLRYTYSDHARYFRAFIKALELRHITLVTHDWGSFLGFDYAMEHPENIKGLAFMEAMLMPVPSYDAMPEQVRAMMKALRDPKQGEELAIKQNIFIEKILPAMVVRKLTDAEMNAYRAPYRDPSSRRPLLQWPNELVIGGVPQENYKRQVAYLEKLKQSPLPKLLIHADHGALIPPQMAEWAKQNLKNLKTVSVGEGRHFIQEDHPDKIGRALSEWYAQLD